MQTQWPSTGEQKMARFAYAVSVPLILVGMLVAISLPRSHPEAVKFLPHGITAPILDEGRTAQSSRVRQNDQAERPENATVSVLEFFAAAGVVVDLLAEGTYPAMQSRRP
jgi:hypothetical protein